VYITRCAKGTLEPGWPLGELNPIPPIRVYTLIALPVSVEATPALVADVLGEDGLEGAQAADGVDVAHDAHHHYGRGLQDGDRLYLLTLGLLCWQRRAERHGTPAVQQKAGNKAFVFVVYIVVNLLCLGLD